VVKWVAGILVLGGLVLLAVQGDPYSRSSGSSASDESPVTLVTEVDPFPPEQSSPGLSDVTEVKMVPLSISELAGKGYHEKLDCARCHSDRGFEISSDRMADAAWLKRHFADPENLDPGKELPVGAYTSLSKYLGFLEHADRQPLKLPAPLKRGAMIVMREECLECHRIRDEGEEIGPDLSRIATKHPTEWFRMFLLNPQMNDPYSPMPSMEHLTNEEMDDLVAFLSTLN